MKNYVRLLVMLVLGAMLTACSEEWWDGRKYGTDRTLEDITVKGNVAFLNLPDGKTETVYLDSVKSEKEEIVLADTIDQVWNAIDVSTFKCEKTRMTSCVVKKRMGNFRVYDAKIYTVLKFADRSVVLPFTHDVMGVEDASGKDELRNIEYRYVPHIEIVNLAMPYPETYGLASYHLQIEVFDEDIPVGTIDLVLKVYAESGVRIMI